MKGMKLKRIFITVLATLALLLGLTALTACKKEAPPESALRGTFTYSETINQGLVISHDAPGGDSANDRQYLYSNVYPINSGIQNTRIAYGIDQRLKLNRDFTYVYEYSVLLSNPGDWGGQCARLAVNITGTFQFIGGDTGEYTVLLSNPTGGTQQVFGATIARPDIYGWSIHSQPDLTLDYSLLSMQEGYTYDEYVRSRVVTVNKTTKEIADDVFYPELLNYIALYSTYWS